MYSARHACNVDMPSQESTAFECCIKLTPQKTCKQGFNSIPRFFILARLRSNLAALSLALR